MDNKTLCCVIRHITHSECVNNVYVLPRDKLKIVDLTRLPAVVIVNTDKSGDPGKHWIAFYMYKDSKSRTIAEYFDSYGQTLANYNVEFPVKIKDYNCQTLQSMFSNVCGLHVIFFVYHRVRGKSLKDVIKLYSSDENCNDMLVRRFFEKLNVSPCQSDKFSQICVNRVNSKL